MKTRSERCRFGHNGDIDGWGGGSLHQQGEDGALGELEDGAGNDAQHHHDRGGRAQREVFIEIPPEDEPSDPPRPDPFPDYEWIPIPWWVY